MIFIQIERINLTSMIDANPLFSTRGTAAISKFACNTPIIGQAPIFLTQMDTH